MRPCWRAVSVAALALAMGLAEPARCQDDGVSVDSVLFGQSAALSGPNGRMGRDFRAGLLAAFAEANSRGGVHGRKLELMSLDDGYDPERAIANTRQLIDVERVFALIGFVGNLTARATAPIAAAGEVPFIAPRTGAAFLREQRWSNVVNMRASSQAETDEIVRRLVSDLGLRRIAVLHRDGSLGQEGLTGVEGALAKRGLSPVARAVYARNTAAVKTAVLELRRASPEAVVLIGTYRPVAAAIAWSRHLGLNPVFAATSLAGGNAMLDELNRFGTHSLYVTEIVPSPGSDARAARSYRRAMAAHAPELVPGFVSFEGYLAGRLAIVGLDRSGQAVDRVFFLESLLDDDPIDLGGFRLRFGSGDNQGSEQVYLARIGEDGKFRPASRMERGP